MRVRPSLVACLSVAIGTSGLAQAPAPAQFNPAIAAEYADSFVTLVRGQPGGWHTYTMLSTSSGYAYAETAVVTGVMSRRISVALDQSLAVLRARDESDVMGTATGSDLAYTGLRARGTIRALVNGTVSARDVDTTFAPGTINALAMLALLPTVEWRAGGAHSIAMYDPAGTPSRTAALRVVGEEQVTVPAGSFDSYRVEVVTTRVEALLWFTRTAPHRLVRLASADGSFVDELVTP